MFNVRSVLVILLALICGGIAAMGAQGMVRVNNRDAGRAKTVKVLVPKVALERGTPIDESLLEWAEWPESPAVKHMVRDMSSATGRRCREDLSAGEPIVEGNLAARGEIPSAATMIGEGMRAICIQFQTPAAAMAGLIFPKDRVDLYLTEPARAGSATPSSRLLLSNVEVFAIGDQVTARRDKEKEKSKELQATSVTFHISVKDAAILDAARSEGQLSIGLRNPTDTEVSLPEPVSPDPGLDSVQPALSVLPTEQPVKKATAKPAVSKPILFLRGNDSRVIKHTWAQGR